MLGAGALYDGGASEFADGLAKGLATVAGFAGRRVGGALKAVRGSLEAETLDDVFDGFERTDDVRSSFPFLLDFRLKKLREGIF